MPTLDEERVLPSLLDHLAAHFEFVVADGGSTDATVACARAHVLAPRVVGATGGRARQLNVAAESARGDLLVFLHADSRLPAGAYWSLASAWRDPAVVGGNFALRFEGEDLFARTLPRSTQCSAGSDTSTETPRSGSAGWTSWRWAASARYW